MMNAHFSASVPNLRIMEIDIDRLTWDHELFTHVPEIVDGHLIMPDRTGWGAEPNEEALLPDRTGWGAEPNEEALALIRRRAMSDF